LRRFAVGTATTLGDGPPPAFAADEGAPPPPATLAAVPPAVEDAADADAGVPGTESGPAKTSRSSDGAAGREWCDDEAAPGVLTPLALAALAALAPTAVAAALLAAAAPSRRRRRPRWTGAGP
jgi:hypothetical protein